jgi:hypothetical protein
MKGGHPSVPALRAFDAVSVQRRSRQAGTAFDLRGVELSRTVTPEYPEHS